eukprot:5340773-Amphidinium_carterae.1
MQLQKHWWHAAYFASFLEATMWKVLHTSYSSRSIARKLGCFNCSAYIHAGLVPLSYSHELNIRKCHEEANIPQAVADHCGWEVIWHEPR